MLPGSLCPQVHLIAQANSRREAGMLDLCQGQKLLVVTLGDINHQLLGTLWKLPWKQSWGKKDLVNQLRQGRLAALISAPFLTYECLNARISIFSNNRIFLPTISSRRCEFFCLSETDNTIPQMENHIPREKMLVCYCMIWRVKASQTTWYVVLNKDLPILWVPVWHPLGKPGWAPLQ